MVVPFEIVDLAEWTRGESEPGGDEAKRWFLAPESSPHAGHWLFKPRTEKTLTLSATRRARGDEPDLLVGGEDWAEKITYELAKLAEIPAADTELATVVRWQDGRQSVGSMSHDMRPGVEGRAWTWTPGAALLAECDDEFDAQTCEGHTIVAVQRVLEGLRGPVNTAYSSWDAFDVFVGYLVLDAWVANTDRHAHNWGVLQNSLTGDVCLGPSFDHGSALASGQREEDRAERSRSETIPNWCAKGNTKRFDGGRKQGLVDIASDGLSRASGRARQHWVDRIAGVDLEVCNDVVVAVPDLSDPTRRFLQTAIATNRKRLCDALK
ncbi:UNVERIFIED_CONTAM: hypothetical protein DES50_12329 [Williamsia faeni]